MKIAISILTMIFCFAGTTHAQFLKKLEKRIEQAAEKVILNKAEEKVTEETEKALNDALDIEKEAERREESARNDEGFDEEEYEKRQGAAIYGAMGLSKVKPADSYSFNTKAMMQLTSEKDVIDLDYYLSNSEDILGVALIDKKMDGENITIFDASRETMFMFMDYSGKKSIMGIAYENDDFEEDTESINIVATGNSKTIMGYKCLEYKMTGESMTADVWVTKDVDIRFPTDFYNTEQSKANNQKWLKDIDGWAMEMTMIDTSKRKPETIVMKCLSIDKTDYRINSSEYPNMGSY